MTTYRGRQYNGELDSLLARLQREHEAKPRRELSTYRVEEPGRPARSVMICCECFRSLEEPVRATRPGSAQHARACDWCGCRNAAQEGRRA